MSSVLASREFAAKTLTYFAIGGSGARSLEPMLHLCALGLGPRRLKVVIIDPDQSNAAVTRSRQLMDLYRQTREALLAGKSPEDGYFRTEVTDAVGTTPVWSPIADDEHLDNSMFRARIDRSLMTGNAAPLGEVFDLLFSNRQATMDMTLGFRGVPSIGTVFMNRLRDQGFFAQLLTDAQTDADSTFFSVGSVFGGTGAAGLPVVGRLLVNGITKVPGRNDVRGVPKRRVGAALLMPYFTLPAPATREAPDGGIRPEAALFAQNAAAAMPSYTDGQAGYGSYYVLGDSEPREQERNEVGGEKQANPSHYVELYAALAALDFASRGGESEQEQNLPVFRAAGVNQNNVRWSDLPLDEASRQRLLGGFVAAHTFLLHFRPNGKSHPNLGRAIRGATWLSVLGLNSSQFQERSPAHDLLGHFFAQTWAWATELRKSNPAMELIRADGRAPDSIESHECIDGRRAATDKKPTSRSRAEVFRHWNVEAVHSRNDTHTGFLETMRRASESFAKERFPETVNE